MHLDELLTIRDVEELALSVLPRSTIGYYFSGADEENTLRDNNEAFDRFLLLPRMMLDVSLINMKCSILGQSFAMPIAFAPSAMHRLAHPDGELATVKAASCKTLLMVLSTLSTTSLEDVAEGGGSEGLRWFQLYVYKDRELTLQLVRRAEKAGYRAIVLTIDAHIFGRRLVDCRNKFALPPDLKLANFEGLQQADVPQAATSGSGSLESGLSAYVLKQLDASLTWETVDWLRTCSCLPIVVKGVLTAEDAENALAHGAAGIIVSNHGGRQLDSVPASIEVLPNIVKVVTGRCPVMLDGGVRRGTDVLKALALGAQMVFIGRPVLYGLAAGGQEGVCRVVDILHDELMRAMILSGCPDVSNIPNSVVIHKQRFTANL